MSKGSVSILSSQKSHPHFDTDIKSIDSDFLCGVESGIVISLELIKSYSVEHIFTEH